MISVGGCWLHCSASEGRVGKIGCNILVDAGLTFGLVRGDGRLASLLVS